MQINPNRFKELKISRDGVKIFIISMFLAIAWFYLQGDVGLNFADEGYLWHNSQQVLKGNVPVRDFRSYDPGRYYWTAFWFKVTGDDGILSLRFSCVLFQVIGLFCGLLLVRRMTKSWWLLIFIGLLVMLSMSPRHKYFEIVISIVALLYAVRLIEKPSLMRHFAAGCVTALSAFIGKNFGMYFLVSFFFVILFIYAYKNKNSFWKRLGIFTAGLVAGYLPEFVLIVFAPGFFNSFFDSVLRLFSPYAPVKSLPIPWPWSPAMPWLPSMKGGSDFIMGSSYLIAFVFYAVGALLVFAWRKKQTQEMAIFAASIFIGIPLLHHVCIRAGVSHFSQGMMPIITGLISLIAILWNQKRFRLGVIPVGLILGFFFLNFVYFGEVQGMMQKIDIWNKKSEYVKFPIQNDDLWVHRGIARYLAAANQFFTSNMKVGEGILVAPYQPMMYCVLGKSSPVWDAFPIHMATVSEQNRMIRDMESKHVNWAMISDRALDGIPERKFRETHAIVWSYLEREFEQKSIEDIPEEQMVFCRKKRQGTN